MQALKLSRLRPILYPLSRFRGVKTTPILSQSTPDRANTRNMFLQRRSAGGSSLIRALDDFETLLSRRAGTEAVPYCPRFDMREMKDRYILEGELPGVQKKDVNIEFSDPNTLSISGHTEQATSKEGPEHAWWYSERTTGDFRRSFNFPTAVDRDNVEASLDNGVLQISLPKTEAAPAGKRIDIK